jgi:hypothetical protein
MADVTRSELLSKLLTSVPIAWLGLLLPSDISPPLTEKFQAFITNKCIAITTGFNPVSKQIAVTYTRCVATTKDVVVTTSLCIGITKDVVVIA